MKQASVQPIDATFVLPACNHSGLGEEGWVLFHHIRKHGVEPATSIMLVLLIFLLVQAIRTMHLNLL